MNSNKKGGKAIPRINPRDAYVQKMHPKVKETLTLADKLREKTRRREK